VVSAIDPVTKALIGAGLGEFVRANGWLLLAPIDATRASYNPALFLLVIAGVFALTVLIVHRLYHARVRRSGPWDCGFPLQTARMQDTAEGFGQPIRQVFEPFYRMTRELPGAADKRPRYRVVVEDHLWYWLYLPIARSAEFGARLVSFLQQGRLGSYLLYSFLTLLALLFFVRG
jgi:hydrogenase-4 component B